MDGCGRTASGTAVERPLQRILRSRHSHFHVQHNAGRLQGCRRYASMDGCGTTPRMEEVELRREQPSRATQEQLPSGCRDGQSIFVSAPRSARRQVS